MGQGEQLCLELRGFGRRGANGLWRGVGTGTGSGQHEGRQRLKGGEKGRTGQDSYTEFQILENLVNNKPSLAPNY